MYRLLKRLLDIVGASLGLLLLSPALIGLAVVIRSSDGGPVFYRGVRTARGGGTFRIFKFRSMVVNADRIGGSSTSGRDPRITRVGAFMRSRKLDELPQLLNVVRGEMSLVGPRPEVPQYTDQFSPEERAILSVRPGITDLASLWNSDEGAVLAQAEDPDRAYEELIRPTKLRLQRQYVREMSLSLDLRILWHTVMATLGRPGVIRELEHVPPILGARSEGA